MEFYSRHDQTPLSLFCDIRGYWNLIKGKLVPVFNQFKHYVMKTYGGVEVKLHHY
jgi:hypothetical protein